MNVRVLGCSGSQPSDYNTTCFLIGHNVLVDAGRDLIKQAVLVFKLISRLIEICENECNAKENENWPGREIGRKAANEARQIAVQQLKQVRYFCIQAHWLTERFPDAKLCDVEGLVKLVSRDEIEANDWSLTPAAMSASFPKRRTKNSILKKPCGKFTWGWKTSTPKR